MRPFSLLKHSFSVQCANLLIGSSMAVMTSASVFSSAVIGRAAVRTSVRSFWRFVITAGVQFRPAMVLGPRCVVRLCAAIGVIVLVMRWSIYVARCRMRHSAVHPVIDRSILGFRM